MRFQSFLQKYGLNRLISPLLGLRVSVILVIYLGRQIDYPHFLRLARNFPLWFFFGLFALFLLLNIFRALRFRILLARKELPLGDLFPITLCHNFFVCTLPLMVGEFSYIALLRRHLKIPVSEGVRSLFDIEKPQNPPTNLVIEGVYYIQNSELLFHYLDEIIEKDIRTHNEYQLTDGLRLMVEYGERMKIEFINSLQLSKMQLFTQMRRCKMS